MGLFSDVFHIKDRSQEQVASALDKVLLIHGLRRTNTSAVRSDGPTDLNSCAASYAYGSCQGNWATIIQVALAKPETPWPSDLSRALSKELDTYVLSLMVHDDDVLFYNLDRSGDSIDGYNSNPQYFEPRRISESEIKDQRHSPEAFFSLLPAGRNIETFAELLNRGWWHAHNAGTLDDDGLAIDESDAGFVFEGERMEAIGNFLQLHGKTSGYPYAAWGNAESNVWKEFIQAWYNQA